MLSWGCVNLASPAFVLFGILYSIIYKFKNQLQPDFENEKALKPNDFKASRVAKDPYFDTNATRLHFSPAELQPVASLPEGVAGGCISSTGVAS